MRKVEFTKKIDQKEIESKEILRTEVDLKQKLKKTELQLKKNLSVTEVNSKEGLKYEEIGMKKNLRVIEVESKGRLFRKGRQIEKHLERKGQDILYYLEGKRSTQTQIKPRSSDDISKAAADDLMKSGPDDTPLQYLKSDLIDMYRQCHQSLPISPLTDERDVLLLHVYVQPMMCEVESDRLRGHTKFVRNLDSYGDILLGNRRSYSCKNIYITGKAGIGKTVFAKKLALAWCQAHQPEENQQSYFSEEDIYEMKKIDFLFFVLLGDISPTVYDVDEMIQNQILFELSKSYSLAFLEDVLHYHQCLIVLDGLDQWSCGRSIKIPHRKARERCKFITTTRSWKLDEIQLKSSEIDKLIEITELGKPVTDQLKSKLLSTVMPNHNHNEFSEFLCRYKVENFINSPLMLTHLVCIWADPQYPHMSRGKLYESIIDLLMFSREFKSKENRSLLRKVIEVMQYFSWLPSEKNRVLNELGNLAFNMCLENKSSLTIYDGKAETILSEEVFSLCVHTGMLSQKEQYGPLTYRKSTVSFMHRSVQDYFAALHLQANPSLHFQPTSQIPLSSILEMSDTFIFLSSIDPTAAGKVFDSLHNIELVKDAFERYRTTLDSHYYHDVQTQIIEFQNMVVNCVIESIDNGHKQINFSVKDIVINDLCLDEPYMSAMKLLINMNKPSIQSILFLDDYSYSLTDVTSIFDLQNFSFLQKLDISGYMIRNGFENLVKSENKLEYLQIYDYSLKNMLMQNSLRSNINFEDRSLRMIESLQHLKGLHLQGIDFTHSQLESILRYIECRKSMRHIGLEGIRCKEQACRGHYLYLSERKELEVLSLYNVSQLYMFVPIVSVRELLYGYLSLTDEDMLLFSLYRSDCWSLKVYHTESPRLLNFILSMMLNLKHFMLCDSDIGDNKLLPGENLEDITLHTVKMKCSVLNGLFNRIEAYPHFERLQMVCCTIEPEDEYQHFKQMVTSSSSFIVLKNGLNSEGVNEFTIQKHQDK